jgi:DNA invertase Pin-like site-specific DNA recombinase
MMAGYARVSTDGQTLDAQQAALREEGATRVFAKNQSGARTDRAVLARLYCFARGWRHASDNEARSARPLHP